MNTELQERNFLLLKNDTDTEILKKMDLKNGLNIFLILPRN